jgi:hypothetical protein
MRIRIDIHPVTQFRCVAVVLTILRQLPSVIKEAGWEAIINIYLFFIDPLFLLKRNCTDAAPCQKHGYQ